MFYPSSVSPFRDCYPPLTELLYALPAAIQGKTCKIMDIFIKRGIIAGYGENAWEGSFWSLHSNRAEIWCNAGIGPVFLLGLDGSNSLLPVVKLSSLFVVLSGRIYEAIIKKQIWFSCRLVPSRGLWQGDYTDSHNRRKREHFKKVPWEIDGNAQVSRACQKHSRT